MFAKSLSYTTALALMFSASISVNAAIVINGTRVIFPSDQKNITVQVKNEGSAPALMQTWIDNGDADVIPDESDVPFVVMPPVSRVDPMSGQTIQISNINADLPQDRESVYWLNVLDIPAKPQTTDAEPDNLLQIAIRNRIKIFYRPKQLQGKAIDAPKKLQWELSSDSLTVNNPTPYYVNISNLIAVSNVGKQYELAPDGLMLSPFSNKNIELKNLVIQKINLLSINDYGGINSFDVELKH